MSNSTPRTLEQLLQSNKDLRDKHARQVETWKQLSSENAGTPPKSVDGHFNELDPQFG